MSLHSPLQRILEQVYAGAPTLELSHAQVKDDDIEILAEILKVNETVTTLHLNNNHMTRRGAEALLEACKINPRITAVDLSCNPINCCHQAVTPRIIFSRSATRRKTP